MKIWFRLGFFFLFSLGGNRGEARRGVREITKGVRGYELESARRVPGVVVRKEGGGAANERESKRNLNGGFPSKGKEEIGGERWIWRAMAYEHV